MDGDGKMNLILDIDNTLLSAESTNDFDFDLENDKTSEFRFHDMDGYYVVFERPHVQEFLDYAFKNFNVSIWTAASKDYAIYIINNVILSGHPERKDKIDYVFYCYHCDVSVNKMRGTKDLNMLWDAYRIDGYTKENTFIMDDYDEVKNTNPDNCILVKAFYYFDKNSENDTYLRDIIPVMDRLKPGKRFLENVDLLDERSDISTIEEKTAPNLMEIDIINTNDTISEESIKSKESIKSEESMKSEQSIYEEIFNEDTKSDEGNSDVVSDEGN